MNLKLILAMRIATRYCYSRMDSSTSRILAILASLAIGLGVSILVVVLSVINGFENTIINRTLAVSSHALAFPARTTQSTISAITQTIEKRQTVNSVSPYIRIEGMAFHNGRAAGAVVEGIVLEKDGSRLEENGHITKVHLSQLSTEPNTVLLGHSLASHLDVETGEEITIAIPRAFESRQFKSPIYVQFEVKGVFRIGMEQYDRRLIVTSIKNLQHLFRTDNYVSGLRLTFNEPMIAPEETSKIMRDVADLSWAIDWTSYHKSFFESLKSQKRMMLVVLGLIIAVAAFNVASNISVTIFDKNSDIALFIALGMTKYSIRAIFLIQTIFIATVGLILGCVVGVGISTQVTEIVKIMEDLVGFQIVNPAIYFIDHLPAEFSWNDLFIISAITLGVSLAAGYYPAHRASQTSPMVLRRRK